jgi:hypothetical protein
MATEADYRAAALGMVEDCAANASIDMQTYAGRPKSVYPPTGFIDSMSDSLSPYPGSSTLYQHNRTIEVLMVWGLFDSATAVSQRDAWVDAFHDWVRARPHEAGAASLIGPLRVADEPDFVPTWLPEASQQSYFATRITLEGFATD